MNQLSVYCLLALFCINIFGASIAELIHFLDHSMGQHATHTHHSTQEPSIYIHTHNGETHEHGLLITALSKAFELDNTDLHQLYNLNLLMLVLDALLSYNTWQLECKAFFVLKINLLPACYISSYLDVATPPPKYLL